MWYNSYITLMYCDITVIYKSYITVILLLLIWLLYNSDNKCYITVITVSVI